MADDVDGWRDAPPPVQLTLFPRLSANIRAVLRLIEGPNPRAEAAAALDLQARCYKEQLHLMRELFEAQLVAMREAAHEAARNEIWAQFAAAGLGLEAQEEEEKGEDELPRASVEDVDKGRTPPWSAALCRGRGTPRRWIVLAGSFLLCFFLYNS